MQEQVIDLAHPGRTVLLRLLRVLKSKRVKHVHLAALLESSIQVMRHLVLGRGTGSLAAIEVEGLVRVRFRDHLEPNGRSEETGSSPNALHEASHACPCDDGLAEQPSSSTLGVFQTSAIH